MTNWMRKTNDNICFYVYNILLRLICYKFISIKTEIQQMKLAVCKNSVVVVVGV